MQALKIIGLLMVSWCVMALCHETGHVIGGWLGGGTLVFLELRPWEIPQSQFDPDPCPLLTLWCGPLVGTAVPVGMWLLIRHPVLEFIAAFCVVANGLYLAASWASPDRFLDTPRLLTHGAHPLSIAGFCLATLTIGYPWLRQICWRLLAGPQLPERVVKESR